MKTVLDRPLDLEDLLATPDDGNRYEVLDGALVMTPPPGTRHQQVVVELAVLLRAAARPLGLQTFVAPVAWRIGPGSVPEPDLLVAAPEAVTERAVCRVAFDPSVLVVRRTDQTQDREARPGGVDQPVPGRSAIGVDASLLEQVPIAAGCRQHLDDQDRSGDDVTGEPFSLSVVPADLLAHEPFSTSPVRRSEEGDGVDG